MTLPRGRLIAALALIVVAWLGLCALLLVGARRDVSNGLDAVNAAKRLTAPDDVLAGAPIRPLVAARRAFRSAHSRLGHPLLAPVKIVPVVGRQLRAADALAAAATRIASVGADGVTEARAALKLPHATGPERIAMLRRLHDVAASADRSLASVKLGPSKALVGVLADKRAEVADKLASVRKGVHDASVASAGLADVLAGPRRYLVFAANNAEMRAGSGDFLSAGELTITNGTLSLGPLRWTGDLHIDGPNAPLIEDRDLADRWGFENPNREFRNLGVSPRFDANAALAARMWTAIGGQPVDGVLAIDPVALHAFLKALGPVPDPSAPGNPEVNADNVVGLLLHDQYAALPAPGPHFDAAQALRREGLGQIAKAVFDRLSTSSFDVASLGGSLADVAKGRHLLAWSSRAGDQAAWKAAAVDGSLDARSMMVSVLNAAANKLDPFLRVKADLLVAANGKSSLTVTLTNNTPPGENFYVAGPFPGVNVGAGDYKGFVAVNLPKFAADITVDGFDSFVAAGPDGPVQVVAVPVVVKRGESVTVSLHMRLPARGSMRVEPSARVPATVWHYQGRAFQDTERQDVQWG